MHLSIHYSKISGGACPWTLPPPPCWMWAPSVCSPSLYALRTLLCGTHTHRIIASGNSILDHHMHRKTLCTWCTTLSLKTGVRTTSPVSSIILKIALAACTMGNTALSGTSEMKFNCQPTLLQGE